jgi:pimeloyl-ACP methyl ester carboxylesterase
VQIPIIRAIGKTKDAKAIDLFRTRMTHAAEPVQLAIVDALGQINSDDVLPMLGNVLYQKTNLPVQMRAISMLGNIGGEKGIYVLRSVLTQITNPALKRAIDLALARAMGVVALDKTDPAPEQGRRSTGFYKGTYYYFYRPVSTELMPVQPWLLVCVHGRDLAAEAIFLQCYNSAKSLRLAVLAPVFDDQLFPDYASFSASRSDKRLLELVDFLGSQTNFKKQEIFLYGYEAGGNFVQRFTLAYPDRVARAAFVSNAFMALNPDIYFPTGLKNSPLYPDLAIDLRKVLKVDFAILLQEGTTQGRQATKFYQGLRDFAESIQISSRPRTKQISAKAIDPKTSWNAAVDYLFPKE